MAQSVRVTDLCSRTGQRYACQQHRFLRLGWKRHTSKIQPQVASGISLNEPVATIEIILEAATPPYVLIACNRFSGFGCHETIWDGDVYK